MSCPPVVEPWCKLGWVDLTDSFIQNCHFQVKHVLCVYTLVASIANRLSCNVLISGSAAPHILTSNGFISPGPGNRRCPQLVRVCKLKLVFNHLRNVDIIQNFDWLLLSFRRVGWGEKRLLVGNGWWQEWEKQNLGYAMARNTLLLSCFDTRRFSGIRNLLQNAKIAALNNATFKIVGR